MTESLKDQLVRAYRAGESFKVARDMLYRENCSRHDTAWLRSAYAAIAEVEGPDAAAWVKKGGTSRMASWLGVGKGVRCYMAPPKKTARDAWGETPMKSQAGAYAQTELC